MILGAKYLVVFTPTSVSKRAGSVVMPDSQYSCSLFTISCIPYSCNLLSCSIYFSLASYSYKRPQACKVSVFVSTRVPFSRFSCVPYSCYLLSCSIFFFSVYSYDRRQTSKISVVMPDCRYSCNFFKFFCISSEISQQQSIMFYTVVF